MEHLKESVITEFKKLAVEHEAHWDVSGPYCEISKHGVVIRVRWSIERIEGVFVTVLGHDNREYGLPYLVEFRGGTPDEIAAASSNDPISCLVVSRKYMGDLLEGVNIDLQAFGTFVEERVRANMPSVPAIKATKFVRPEW